MFQITSDMYKVVLLSIFKIQIFKTSYEITYCFPFFYFYNAN